MSEVKQKTLAEMTDKEKNEIVQKYVKKFTTAKRFREPTEKKNLRLHKLYRAYRDSRNEGKVYPYHTNIMPPIAFGLIETVKPRLSAGRMRLRVLPGSREFAGSEELTQWETLSNNIITGNTQFQDEKVEWIHSMLNYGNGYMMIHWNAKENKPHFTSLDNWLLYTDPNAGPNLEGSTYEVRQIFRDINTFKKANKDSDIYHGVDKIQGGGDQVNDPRWERERIESLRMGQIAGNGEVNNTEEEKRMKEKQLELLEIYDHIEGKLVTIANRTQLIRYDDNPYKNVNGGRIIVDLPCIKVPWTKEAMSILEPVESNINEIADIRNHAMENLAYNMDPIRKVRKSAELTAKDIETKPGALWQLANSDDVVIERPESIGKDWIEAINLLRNEVDGTLALSEYTSGNPHSSQEPADKVQALLKQSGIRFSQLVRQYEKSLNEVATIVRDMYKEFLPEGLEYRDDYNDSEDFETFNASNADVELRYEVEPDQAKTPVERRGDLLEVYKLFIEDVPQEGADEQEVARYSERKKLLQRMILEEYGQDQYAEVMATLEERIEEEADQATEEVDQLQPEQQLPVDGPPQGPQQAPGILQRLGGMGKNIINAITG